MFCSVQRSYQAPLARPFVPSDAADAAESSSVDSVVCATRSLSDEEHVQKEARGLRSVMYLLIMTSREPTASHRPFEDSVYPSIPY